MSDIEVFADITCPFTHVGLHRLVAERERRDRADVRLIVRAWPLELINGAPLRGADLMPKVEALRASVAPDLFTGFDPDRFPTTSVPALALVASAYRRSAAAGEHLSLALRTALFEGGADLGDPAALGAVLDDCDLHGLKGDTAAVYADWREGMRRNVKGSPHFFLPAGDFFCPSLEITHPDGALHVAFDAEGFDAFADAAFGSTAANKEQL